MNNKEAIFRLEALLSFSSDHDLKNVGEALKMAISALERVECENTLWHDTKTDPPKKNGMYYGKKDDTNSMYLVNYKDGEWSLNAYPDQKIEILWWAEYSNFEYP